MYLGLLQKIVTKLAQIRHANSRRNWIVIFLDKINKYNKH